jgi:DDE family transposase
VNASITRQLAERKRRILQRLQPQPGVEHARPMLAASNIHYELAERTSAIAAGGLGAIHLMVQKLGLVRDLDANLLLLKRHLPYHESDHVLNLAYNILAGGQRIEHLELRRNDEAYLDALGAQRIPDPTTAGDFCRRFRLGDVLDLMDAINQTRLRVWAQQPQAFFDQATIDVDGTLVPTDAQCKEGVDIAYNGIWGYHALVVSLANTQEPLFLANRSGNRPSHELAAHFLDQAAKLCRQAGFGSLLFRGDTDFTQTKHLDRWDDAGDIRFLFGIDAMRNLVALAESAGGGPETAYSQLERPPKYQVKTVPRRQRVRYKQQIVHQRGFKDLHTLAEHVAELAYRPVACDRAYRLIVLRKHVATDQEQLRLFDDYRYFFFLTNDRELSAAEVVLTANQRCNQENLIAQLKGGVHALTAPVDNLHSNWAYMVMASLAWSLKAWAALLVPESPRHAVKHRAEKQKLLRMEFRSFCAAVIAVPCQIIQRGRRLVYRLLSWNPWQGVFLRLVQRLHGAWLC